MKSKKGSILGDIGSLMQNFFQTLPKPVKFIIFLAILLLIGVIIQYSLYIFGIYCDSANNPVKLSSGIFANIGLINEIPDDMSLLDKEVVEIEETPATKILGKSVSLCSQYYSDYRLRSSNGTETWFYNEGRYFYDGTYCTDCEAVRILPIIYTNANRSSYTPQASEKKYCLGDVQHKENYGGLFGWMKKSICLSSSDVIGGACNPPKNYFYSYQINTYLCANNNCTGITLGQIWDDKLKNSGGVSLYPNGDNVTKSYTSAVNIKCEDLSPKIAVFGIPVFDYKLWFMILLIGVVLWVYMKIKHVTD
jgi:hypothetical protein